MAHTFVTSHRQKYLHMTVSRARYRHIFTSSHHRPHPLTFSYTGKKQIEPIIITDAVYTGWIQYTDACLLSDISTRINLPKIGQMKE